MLGHMAFKELTKGYQIYDNIKNYSIIHKSNSPSQYLDVGAELHKFRSEEIKHYISAVILFQSMMEAIINNETNCGKSFAEKWQNKLDITKTDKCSFNSYDLNFYKKLRNPIIHPKIKHEQVQSLDFYQFKEVYSGMWEGWNAFKELYNLLGKKHDDNSWEIMCNTYSLPISIDDDFIDTGKISGNFFKKHLDWFNINIEKSKQQTK